MTLEKITKIIIEKMSHLEVSHFGFTPLSKPLTFEFYEEWLKENLNGEMSYLKDHAPIKKNPQLKWARARTALVFAMPYYPHPEKKMDFPLKQARLSLYAQGYDYHFWFKDRMNQLCTLLKAEFPEEEFLSFTDSSPILERDLARRAKLGWVGKNTCLIHPKKGSLFFIGEIYTSLTAMDSPIELLPDFCGTCTRCIDICPTQAFIEPRKMDATKCISYLTIESRSIPPENLRDKMGDWFFGCDLCQTVCPWNEKIFKGQLNKEAQLVMKENDLDILIEELRYILTSSGKKLEKDFWGTPLARAGSFGLKRNALIVLGNKKLGELKNEVLSLVHHEKLGPLAEWALTKIQ